MTARQAAAKIDRFVLRPRAVVMRRTREAFSRGLEDVLRNCDLRKAHLRPLVVDVQIIDGEIRFSGSKGALLAAAEAGFPVEEWRP